MQAKAQLACGVQGAAAHSPASHHHHQWPDSASISALLRQDAACSARRPGGPLDDFFTPELVAGFRDDVAAAAGQHCAGKVDAGELQYLAQAMMRSPNYSL
jgi:LOB domain-containing protein 16